MKSISEKWSLVILWWWQAVSPVLQVTSLTWPGYFLDFDLYFSREWSANELALWTRRVIEISIARKFRKSQTPKRTICWRILLRKLLRRNSDFYFMQYFEINYDFSNRSFSSILPRVLEKLLCHSHHIDSNDPLMLWGYIDVDDKWLLVTIFRRWW